MGGLTFPGHLKLLKRPHFLACYERGRRYQTRHFIVFIRPNQLNHWRLGITASRKTGPAVLRNRIKRLVRETFRLHQHQININADIVVVCKKRQDLRELDLGTVRDQLLKLLIKIGDSNEKNQTQS